MAEINPGGHRRERGRSTQIKKRFKKCHTYRHIRRQESLYENIKGIEMTYHLTVQKETAYRGHNRMSTERIKEGLPEEEKTLNRAESHGGYQIGPAAWCYTQSRDRDIQP